MARTTHDGYTAAASTVHSTSLNSLANNADSAASSAIDNTTNLDLFVDLELVLATQGSTRGAGATVAVYAVYALDGTNYGDLNPTTAVLLAVFALDAATTARRAVWLDCPVSPGLMELFVHNSTAQAFAASGNTLKARFHSVKTV